MNHFDYRNGVLHAEAVNLIDLADAVGTPFYCYSTATLERHYRVFTEAFAGEKVLVCYAMKANSNQSVLRTLAKLGAGADVVSGGELKRALAAGIPPDKILFSGIGKTEAELRAALAANILCINVESEPELELLSRLAVEAGKTARISVRVNPDVDAGTHAKIATGKSENKFGVPLARARAVYARAAKLPGIEVTGTDVHIGSQITELSSMETAFRILAEFVQTLRADGHDILSVTLPAKGAATITADVVGPVCETGDYLALDRTLPTPKVGDLLAIMTAGAYGAVQAGTYNTRALVPEVLVKGAEWALVRPRLDVDSLIALDRMPDWL